LCGISTEDYLLQSFQIAHDTIQGLGFDHLGCFFNNKV
jgi:hypothetical protein